MSLDCNSHHLLYSNSFLKGSKLFCIIQNSGDKLEHFSQEERVIKENYVTVASLAEKLYTCMLNKITCFACDFE